jgi:hypothetical protein
MKKRLKVWKRFISKSVVSLPRPDYSGMMEGNEWIELLEKQGVSIASIAKGLIFYSGLFPASIWNLGEVVAFRDSRLPGNFWSRQIHEAAARRKWKVPHPEIALFIARSMTDGRNLYDLSGQEGLIVMHRPLDDGATPYLLGVRKSAEEGVVLFVVENTGFKRGLELGDGGMSGYDLVFTKQ